MYISRLIEQQISKHIGKQKVILLYGSRRTGKSTIVRHIAKKFEKDTLVMQAEDMQVSLLLQKRTIANYKRITKGKKLIIIDEAQVIPEI